MLVPKREELGDTVEKYKGKSFLICVKLGLNSIKCNNVFSKEIKSLHVSANDVQHRKATNPSKEMLYMKCWSPSDVGHHLPKHIKA
jgi:hypothetical protein